MKPIIALKNRPLIYAITNTINGKTYVGKTKCIYRRCYQYLYDFDKRAIGHINDYLYNAMVKYGIDSFEMVPLEFASVDELAERELWWMNHLDTLNRKKGYNLRADSSTGMITHKITSEKISSRLKKEWAEGKRSGHADKLREKWKDPERRKQQSALFSKIKTKYIYEITTPQGVVETVSYKQLVEYDLGGALSAFHRKKTDNVTVKGYVIKRRSANEGQA